ncbi:MAG: glycosyltransferase family 2 protein [Candidatus Paceibacterota bacterium]
MSSKVSVIIPAYNSARFIEATINSVLSQSYDNIEIIVVDDGSTDRTRYVVEGIQKKDKRVKYFFQQNSGGPASPKNTGFKQSTGEYIAYLDHDDEWLPNKLEKQLALFNDTQSNLGLISCSAYIYEGKKMTRIHRLSKKDNSLQGLLVDSLSYFFSNSSMLIPRHVVEDVGDRDENLSVLEDLDIVLRILEEGYKIDFISEPLIKYNLGDSNLSKDFNRVAQDYKIFMGKYRNLFKKYPKAYSVRLESLATAQVLSGNLKKAKKNLIKSIKNNARIKNVAKLILALLSQNFFCFLFDARKRLR